MKVPADKLLAELIIKHKHAIWKIHDHDSLLEHQVDQEISGNIANGDYPLIVHNFTEVRFASFFSGGFITTIVVNPPERKLAVRTSVYLRNNLTFVRLFIKRSSTIKLLDNTFYKTFLVLIM